MKFIVHAKDDVKENKMTIECHDEEEMNRYAKACRKQGYKEVTTEIKLKIKFYRRKQKWDLE